MMIWIACSISRSRETSAIPPLGLVSGGNAHPLPTKSFCCPLFTWCLSSSALVQLHLRPGELDHADPRVDLHARATLEGQVSGSRGLDRDVARRLERQCPARTGLLDRDRSSGTVLLDLDRRRWGRRVAQDRDLLVHVVVLDRDLVVLGADRDPRLARWDVAVAVVVDQDLVAQAAHRAALDHHPAQRTLLDGIPAEFEFGVAVPEPTQHVGAAR